jgi:hypothetical protein
MMKKNYLNEGMKLLLVGICLVLAAAFSETAVDGLLWGFAGGALAPGIARIIQHFYWSAPKNQVRYQEMKEQADINLHDELNEKLRDKSGRIAYLIGLLIICISEVVFSILGKAGIISNHKLIVLYLFVLLSSDRDWKSGISAVKKKILIVNRQIWRCQDVESRHRLFQFTVLFPLPGAESCLHHW